MTETQEQKMFQEYQNWLGGPTDEKVNCDKISELTLPPGMVSDAPANLFASAAMKPPRGIV